MNEQSVSEMHDELRGEIIVLKNQRDLYRDEAKDRLISLKVALHELERVRSIVRDAAPALGRITPHPEDRNTLGSLRVLAIELTQESLGTTNPQSYVDDAVDPQGAMAEVMRGTPMPTTCPECGSRFNVRGKLIHGPTRIEKPMLTDAEIRQLAETLNAMTDDEFRQALREWAEAFDQDASTVAAAAGAAGEGE